MSLGKTLQDARLERDLTSSEVAAATRMKVQVVEAIEREDFSKIAAPIYAKGFIRLYAEHMELDPVPLIAEYEALFLDESMRPSLKTSAPSPEPEPPAAQKKTAATSEDQVADEPQADAGGETEPAGPHEEPAEAREPEPSAPPRIEIPPAAHVEPAETVKAEPTEPASRDRSGARGPLDGLDLFSRVETKPEPEPELPVLEPEPAQDEGEAAAEAEPVAEAPDEAEPAPLGEEPVTSELSLKPVAIKLALIVVAIFTISGIVQCIRKREPQPPPPVEPAAEELQVVADPPAPYVD